MKYRNMIRNEDGTYNIVWFGSTGIKFVNKLVIKITTSRTVNQIEYIKYHEKSINIPEDGHMILVINMTLYLSTGMDSANVRFLIAPNTEGKYSDIKIIFFNYPAPITKIYDIVSMEFYCPENDFTIQVLSNFHIDEQVEISKSVPALAIKADNYVENQEGIAKSLTQRLAVIKGELWYDINYGLPLLDKIKNKAVFDAYIIQTINAHQEVKTIKEYISKVDHGVYTYTATIISIYGDEFELSSQTAI